MKKILLTICLVLTMGILCSYLVNNGIIRILVHVVFSSPYPTEKRIITEDVVVFDLSKKKPVFLSLGIQYPKGIDLTVKTKNERDDVMGWQMEGSVQVKVYRNNRLIKDETYSTVCQIEPIAVPNLHPTPVPGRSEQRLLQTCWGSFYK